MKKIILLILVSLIWFSCELPDSGRMAVIDFNFNQPDILREADTPKVPDRIIPAESKTVVVVMYPNFSTDYTEEETFPIEGQMVDVLAQESTKILYFNFASGFSGGSLNNIEPGIWNFAVFTFEDAISNLTTDDMVNVMTWRIKKDVNIVPGMNLVELPLKLSDNYFSLPIAYYRNNGAQTQVIPYNTSTYLGLTDMFAGTNLLYFDPMMIAAQNVSLFFYNQEGYLIDSTPTLVSPTEAYISFYCTGTDYTLIIGGSYSVGNSLFIRYDISNQSDLPPNSHRLVFYDIENT